MIRFLISIIILFIGCQKEDQIKKRYINEIIPNPSNNLSEKKEDPKPKEWNEKMFEGEWKTTKNRKLDGIMKCHVRKNGNTYDAKFWGTWQGVDFEYNVEFEGPLENLKGKPCVIDGAHYKWQGSIINEEFKCEYTSNRYDGFFNLKELK